MPLDPVVAAALRRSENLLLLRIPFAIVGQPMRVVFPNAGATRQVTHNFGDVPDGFLIGDATAPVYRVPGQPYTKELAFLTCATANAEATLLFFKWKETPTNV